MPQIGVVVENFSYVYQTTGGSKAVTREEMRAFKKVWAEFANQKTGFLERNNFVPFFRVSASLLAVSNTIYDCTYRNWAVSSRSASIRQSLASETSWPHVRIKAIATTSLLRTGSTCSRWTLLYRGSTMQLFADAESSSAICITKRSSLTTAEREFRSLICCYYWPTTN